MILKKEDRLTKIGLKHNFQHADRIAVAVCNSYLSKGKYNQSTNSPENQLHINKFIGSPIKITSDTS